MDPAVASIIGTAILGGCSIAVALISARSSSSKAVEAATRPLLAEIAQLKSQPAKGGPDDA